MAKDAGRLPAPLSCGACGRRLLRVGVFGCGCVDGVDDVDGAWLVWFVTGR